MPSGASWRVGFSAFRNRTTLASPTFLVACSDAAPAPSWPWNGGSSRARTAARCAGVVSQVAVTMAAVMIGIVGFVFVTVPAFSPVHEHPTWQGLAVQAAASGPALVARHPELMKQSVDVVKPGPSVADVKETAKVPSKSLGAQKLVQASSDAAKVPLHVCAGTPQAEAETGHTCTGTAIRNNTSRQARPT